jgi:DNA-binding PadR family transcriptional regulator
MGPASIDEILERLGPHSAGVTHGTIWTTLERARAHGLVSCGIKKDQKRPYRYVLTEGGERRVAWIKGRFIRKAVANPGSREEE